MANDAKTGTGTVREGGPLAIGWASVDITPPEPVNLIGQMHMRRSEGVADPVTATALALSSGGDGAVIVSLDLVSIGSEFTRRVRESAAARLPDCPPGNIVLSATHTHTAPDVRPGLRPDELYAGMMLPARYVDWLVEKVVDAVERAWKARAPGQIAWGGGYATVAHGRRARYFEELSVPGQTDGFEIHKNARMYGNTNDPAFERIEETAESTLQAVFTYDAAGKLTGMILNVPAPAQITENLHVVSADYWHETRVALRGHFGEGVFVLPQCGAAGDLAPRTLYQRQAEARMLSLRDFPREAEWRGLLGEEGLRKWEIDLRLRQDVARRLLAAVADIEPVARRDIRDKAVFGFVRVVAELPRRMVREDELPDIRGALERLQARPASTNPDPTARIAEDTYRLSAMARCRRALERVEEQIAQPALPCEIQALRLGEYALVSNRFELFQEYAERIQARSPAGLTSVVQLAGDENAAGTYLPTKVAEEGGHYSATVYSNEIGHEGGRRLVEESLALLNKLFTDR